MRRRARGRHRVGAPIVPRAHSGHRGVPPPLVTAASPGAAVHANRWPQHVSRCRPDRPRRTTPANACLQWTASAHSASGRATTRKRLGRAAGHNTVLPMTTGLTWPDYAVLVAALACLL